MTAPKTRTVTGAAPAWLFEDFDARLAAIGADVGRDYSADETATIRFLLTHASLPAPQAAAVAARARELASAIRERQRHAGGLDALLSEYDLSSSEGIVLMCLAEALLRIPDAATADRLIADKLAAADWQAHLGESESLFVNASTWALLLTGRFVRPEKIAQPPAAFLQRLIERIGETVVRSALRQAMKVLGQQFVMGETIEAALQRAARSPDTTTRSICSAKRPSRPRMPSVISIPTAQRLQPWARLKPRGATISRICRASP